MDDRPVTHYTNKAHVFQINPETKTSWLQKGESAIPVSLITTGSEKRRELVIIGTNEIGETVLDCTILPKTIFNKRSPKFGQWTDPNGMIYGLGFGTESELNEFIDTFRQLQQEFTPDETNSASLPRANSIAQQAQLQQNMIMNQSNDGAFENKAGIWGSKAQQQQPHQQQQALLSSDNSPSEMNGRDQNTPTSAKSGTEVGSVDGQLSGIRHSQQPVARRQQVAQDMLEHETNNNTNGNGLSTGSRYPRSQSMFGMQQQQQQTHQKPSSGIGGSRSPNSEIMPQNELQIRDQLKYENERLKQALEESSKNAGIWQSELINLRTNNAKLTQALQESKAHVEEWEKELLGLRDENKELKLRVMTLESTGDAEHLEEHKLNMQEYKNYIDQLKAELRKKDSELDEVQRSMEQLEIKAKTQNGRSDDPISSEVAISSYQKHKLDFITAKLAAKISELQEIRESYAQFSDKLYH